MIYIGIDLGYKNGTTIAIIDTNKESNRFKFMSLSPATEFEDVVRKVVLLMQQYKVPVENVNAPGFPALEHELTKIFRKD